MRYNLSSDMTPLPPKTLADFLLAYVTETGSPHGMVGAAAKHFGCGAAAIRRRIRELALTLSDTRSVRVIKPDAAI